MIGIYWSERGKREQLEQTLLSLGLEVLCAESTWQPRQHTACDLLVVDEGNLQRLQVHSPTLDIGLAAVVVDGANEAAPAVAALRAGALDYLSCHVDNAELAAAVSAWNERVRVKDFVAASKITSELFRLAAKVARTDVAIMIHGESGTGKEVVARFVHDHSDRSGSPFVAVNCAALPENMLEAILFGHEKGAFTGAHESRPGKFEQAHRGTLLLDEVTEMPLALQAKLLRVLQEREVERLGARGPRQVDVRVIATSNRDLQSAIAEGQFREDLFYRLNVFPLRLRPLRERREDILPLVDHFVHKHVRLAPCGRAAGVSASARSQLQEYDWPGNVRELENAIQRALVMSESGVIEPEHLDIELTQLDRQAQDLGTRMLIAEGETIVEVLRNLGGVRKDAARSLGISERTLRYKLKKLRELGVEV